MVRRSRRRFLQISLAGVTTVLAGCGIPGGDEEGGGEEGGGEEGGGEEGGGEEGGEEGGGEEEEDSRAAPTGPSRQGSDE
ncbi:hypothetical protein [Halorussus salinisoli]|uniref:hypothetical protein n=1 Tax=Halorussus salinisoli TaxID=2558242 RepID=UPI0010C1B87D|nr:hypothetical protein [Halorussus salinisoli]